VDSFGGPVIDPTENVKDLTEAANLRQDDLRGLTKELYETKIASNREMFEAKITGLTNILTRFAAHQRELDRAESERLNAIRQVDREEVAKTAAANQLATTTLANSTVTLADTLRAQVATSRTEAEARLTVFSADVNKRLSSLELSSSERQGKQTVADPQMERLAIMVERLAAREQTSSGKSEGMSDATKMLIGFVGLVATMLSIGAVLVTLVLFLNRAPVPTIYTPAPPQTMLPSTPPQQVPR
jgi:hypothetical protein